MMQMNQIMWQMLQTEHELKANKTKTAIKTINRLQFILWPTISHDVKQPIVHSHDPASEVHQQPADCELQSQWTSQTAFEQMLHALCQLAVQLYSDLFHNNIMPNTCISAHTVKAHENLTETVQSMMCWHKFDHMVRTLFIHHLYSDRSALFSLRHFSNISTKSPMPVLI